MFSIPLLLQIQKALECGFDRDMEVNYPINKTGNGVYIFMIDGKATIDDQELGKRDALGVWDTDSFSLTIKKKSRILLLEVPIHY